MIPNHGQHVVKFDAKAETVGSIHIPEKSQHRPNRGKVIAASKGYYTNKGYFVPSLIKDGMTVYVAARGGAKTDKDNVFVVKEQDILGYEGE